MKWLINLDKLVAWQDDCFNNERGKSYKRATFYDVLFTRRAKLKNKHYGDAWDRVESTK